MMGLALGKTERPRLILILGGARSGKSRFAQELAQGLEGQVLFVATARAGDEEMRRRIQEHKKRRPSPWSTLELEGKAGRRIREALRAGPEGIARIVVLDCLTLLISNLLEEGEAGFEERAAAEVEELLETAAKTEATFIIVSNEVGLGIVPENQGARLYRDVVGQAHQRLATAADQVYFMVAGVPVMVKGKEVIS